MGYRIHFFRFYYSTVGLVRPHGSGGYGTSNNKYRHRMLICRSVTRHRDSIEYSPISEGLDKKLQFLVIHKAEGQLLFQTLTVQGIGSKDC
jgi:hypothetical protein